jgi:SAM-dependent methyltransferase
MFKKYAKIYDYFNLDKNYKREINYLLKIIKKFKKKKVYKILDIGCGTGNHANLLAKKKFFIVGLDKSPEMIDMAKKKFKKVLFTNDNRSLSIKFDICYSFFHVVSYLKNNNQLNAFFNYASTKLDKDGLFIFDYWFKPAVLLDPPEEKIKYLKKNYKTYIRFTQFQHFKKFNIIKILFNFFILSKKKIKYFTEIHEMRYYEIKQLNFYLKKNNFVILKNYSWLQFSFSKKKWYACIVAKKI